MSVHPTSVVEDGATIGRNVEIGPFCCIGKDVVVGDNVRLISHVTVSARTTIGAGTIIYPFAALGGTPQHVGYKGEDTKLEIGESSIIREHVTMNIGTEAGGGVTRLGKNGFYMIGAHIAHDCQIGDNATFANNATLAGHVSLGRDVFLGGLCAIHQYSRIGDFAFVGGCAAVAGDVIPYASAAGNHAKLVGLNVIGMKRRGLPRATIHALRAAYRAIFFGDDTLKQRVEAVANDYSEYPEVMQIVSFIQENASRSLMSPTR